MISIPFGQFAPDASDKNIEFIDTVSGMQPTRDGHAPVFSLVAYSEALPGTVIGAKEVRHPTTGIVYIYIATQAGIYILDTSTSPYPWIEVSNSSIQPYTIGQEFPVQFAVFGEYILAANLAWPGLQIATIGVSSIDAFSTLAGSPSSSSVITFADRVFTSRDNIVQWSAPRDHTVWNDISRRADSQEFETGGEVQSMALVNDTLAILQEDAVRLGIRTGDAVQFAFREIRRDFGSVSPNSVVQVPQGIFFLSEDGFYFLAGGGELEKIGAQRVDNWFTGTSSTSGVVDPDRLWSVQGAHDPVNKTVFWRYPRTGSAASGFTDRVIGYNYDLDRWFPLNLNAAMLFRAATPGQFADAITTLVDDLNVPVDSRQFSGGRPQLAAITSDFKLAFFVGSSMAASIETADIQLQPGRRSFCNAVRPNFEGTASFTGCLGTKDTPNGTVSWNDASGPNRAGQITQRADGLFHKAKIVFPAGANWDAISGVELDGVRPAGQI